MNDQVEEIYQHMFAPNPIPQSVRTLYDVTNKYISRVDAQMRTANLAVIAGLAVVLDRGKPESAPTTSVAGLSPTDVIDTTEPDADVPVPAPETPAEGITGAESPVGATSPAHGPTGPMDAPSRPSKNRRGLSKIKMNKLTLPELKEHARQIYGYKPKTNERKKNLIAILGSKEPL